MCELCDRLVVSEIPEPKGEFLFALIVVINSQVYALLQFFRQLEQLLVPHKQYTTLHILWAYQFKTQYVPMSDSSPTTTHSGKLYLCLKLGSGAR